MAELAPVTDELIDVLSDIGAQRQHQIDRGFTRQHDDEHGLGHLITFAQGYAQRGRYVGSYGVPSSRAELVKAAALLVAAIELLDREPDVSGSGGES